MEIRWDWIERHRDDIGSALLGHLELTAISLGIAVAVALPLALAVRRRRTAAAAVVGVAGVLYTIPSIALFGLLVPLIGLGIWPVIIGLVLYAQLTLLRNTLVGLEATPAPVREAATGMGLTPRQVLLKVELPLAVPAIVAGLRAFFHGVCDGSRGMVHPVLWAAVDVAARRVAVHLHYRDEREGGAVYDEQTCNLFELDEQGRLARVLFWRGR